MCEFIYVCVRDRERVADVVVHVLQWVRPALSSLQSSRFFVCRIVFLLCFHVHVAARDVSTVRGDVYTSWTSCERRVTLADLKASDLIDRRSATVCSLMEYAERNNETRSWR